jgi:hypothetical protein
MQKKPFEPRGLNEIGYSSIGCLAQYLYEYFGQQGRRARDTAAELRIQAQVLATKITEQRGEWQAPESYLMNHLEDLLLEVQAHEWIARLFEDFGNGTNPLEDKHPIDFNDVYTPDVFPKISALLRALRTDMERRVRESLRVQLAKDDVTDRNRTSETALILQNKEALAKARILARYENDWNYLHTSVAGSLGISLRRTSVD